MNPVGQKPEASHARPMLRVAEASELLGISSRQLYAWVSDGTVPREAILRVGRRVYLRRTALLRWAAGEDGAEEPAER
jgi:excisionase family DNA binding protein